MSQQGPGGFGGGGPYGPPGGGGYGGPPGGGAPPGGYGPPGGGYPPPGGVPPGYGPPGGAPPGYGPPQNYGPGYPGGPPQGGPPPKKSKALLWVGLGCGGLVLLGAAGAVASYFYMKSKVNDAETAIANLAASGAAIGIPAGGGAVASGTCAKTVACCKIIASKSGSNAALAGQACAAYSSLSDAVCAQQYAALKQTAASLGGACE